MIYRIIHSEMVSDEGISYPITGVIRIDGDRGHADLTTGEFRYPVDLLKQHDGTFRGENARVENPGVNYFPAVTIQKLRLTAEHLYGTFIENGIRLAWSGEIEIQDTPPAKRGRN